MFTDIWFWTTILSLAALATSLSHNITNGAALRTQLKANFDEIKAKLSGVKLP